MYVCTDECMYVYFEPHPNEIHWVGLEVLRVTEEKNKKDRKIWSFCRKTCVRQLTLFFIHESKQTL